MAKKELFTKEELESLIYMVKADIETLVISGSWHEKRETFGECLTGLSQILKKLEDLYKGK